MSYLYIESIRAGAISARTKSGHVHTLFKGLNKMTQKDWGELKEVPLIAAYVKAETLKERPEIKAKGPEIVEPKQEVKPQQEQEPVVEESPEQEQSEQTESESE
jgi:hypothetical protein